MINSDCLARTCLSFCVFILSFSGIKGQTPLDDVKFVRQGTKRLIFDESQSISLAKLDPATVIGMQVMYPANHYLKDSSTVSIKKDLLIVASERRTETGIWFAGFNPFSTYTIDINSCTGEGEVGVLFSDSHEKEKMYITISFDNDKIIDVRLRGTNDRSVIADKSIKVNDQKAPLSGKVIIQMLGSGTVVYLETEGLPQVIGQTDFSQYLDLREKERIHSFQSRLYFNLEKANVQINGADMALTTGVGQADIRAITYENGDAFFDNGRLWYTMSIRGRALPHHIQGVFSMNPTTFDLKLEGIILFDRNDGLLRNEIASHIFYDRINKIWRGITTGFSAYANPEEKKQLLAVESKVDPRFGFSVMSATPFGVVGDIEDPHILFDERDKKWRILTCENSDGYKAIILESKHWNKEYKKVAGPVSHNSTGTSIQKINGKFYCFSGSSEPNIFIYSYPDLKEVGVLNMDLPPWSKTSGSRVWPNVVQLPDGYPFRFVALMMDRFNYPDMKGPNWTYGGLYLYHGY